MEKQEYDVVVVGAGNAALCAALSAREQVKRVLVLEKAGMSERCGNSYFADGGFRFVHQGLEDIRRDVLLDLSQAEVDSIEIFPAYSSDKYYSDLMAVTDHQSNEELARLLIDNSRDTVRWLGGYTIRWLPMFNRLSIVVNGKHRFHGGVTVFASGGGAGLVTSLVAAAGRKGIEVRYDTAARRLIQNRSGAVAGVEVRGPEGIYEIAARSVVLASGGFEANAEWRARYLGRGWDLCHVRGTRHNTGDGIRMALDIGAEPHGNWSSCHAVPWDVSAPVLGDRTIIGDYQKYSYHLGIMVNLQGRRFADEGESYRLFTYAKFGREIINQPNRTAIQIFDRKITPLLRDEYRVRHVTKVESDTVEGLAEKLGIEPGALVRTVNEFNSACQPGTFNQEILDGKRTIGIDPPKSNWAVPLDTPPYAAFVTTCGITFTYGGLRINSQGAVQDTSGRSIPGLYAAGELVGGLFYNSYPGGTGLMAGAVFGRLAGASAGKSAQSVA